MGARLGLGFGALPAVSGAGIAQLGATWTHVRLRLEGVLHPGARGGELPAAVDAPPDPLEVQLLRGQLAGCGRMPWSAAWAFDACVLGSLGALRGRAVVGGQEATTLGASVGLRAATEWQLTGPLYGEARADLHANLTRTRLTLEGERAWITPAFWGELSVLGSLRFP